MAVNIVDLGLVPYEGSIKIQEDLLERRIADRVEDTVVFLEHPRIITMGRSASRADIKNEDFFVSRGIEIISTRRGGGITYHAPGQLVVYPILRLEDPIRDISCFIDTLEKITAESLREFGIDAQRCAGRRGVWAGGRKIAFTGIKIKKWVTFHGVAININNDILPFEMIDPCGEADIRVTSAKAIIGSELDMKKVKDVLL